MNAKDVEKFRKKLLEERERVAHAVGYLHDENPGSTNGDVEEVGRSDNDLADTATETVDREIDSTLEENAEQVLGEIDAALQRIEDGTYGMCEACDKPIGKERLEALPWTRFCIDDARKQLRR